MPKLQHIRVAGKFFMDYEIPVELANLWKYIREMYQLDAFTQSCPADQVNAVLLYIVTCTTYIVVPTYVVQNRKGMCLGKNASFSREKTSAFHGKIH